MALHAVGAADNQHRIIQHLQCPLGLRGKIHMARGVQQGKIGIARREEGLLGENGNAARLFQRVGVQKGILMVHATQLADGAGAVEQGLGKGGLAAVHMGQNADDQLLVLLFHAAASLTVRWRSAQQRPAAGPAPDWRAGCNRCAPRVPAPQRRRSSHPHSR